MLTPKFGEIWRDDSDGETVMVVGRVDGDTFSVVTLVATPDTDPLAEGPVRQAYLWRRAGNYGVNLSAKLWVRVR